MGLATIQPPLYSSITAAASDTSKPFMLGSDDIVVHINYLSGILNE